MILYKYLPPERIDVLLNKSIRFTQPKYLNDQYEALPVFQQLLTQEAFDKHLLDTLNESKTNINIETIIQESKPDLSEKDIKTIAEDPSLKSLVSDLHPFLIDFLKNELTKINPEWMEDVSKKFKETASNRIGILSLSESLDSQIMWTLYAKENKGFVIAFNSNNAFFNQRISEDDQIRFVRPVHYSIERPNWPTIRESYNEHDLSIAIHKTFLTKHTDWEKEKEWRLILPLDRANKVINEEIYLFEFPSNCIDGIILGSNIENETKSSIIGLIKNDDQFSHVKLSQANISNSYVISLSEIKY